MILDINGYEKEWDEEDVDVAALEEALEETENNEENGEIV